MTPLKVLVVEDDYLIAEELRIRLTEQGYAVSGPAHNCSSALEAIWADKPDLAFVDVMLEGETCEVVLTERANLNIPVVICSGYPTETLPVYATGRPVLPKPYPLGEFTQQVDAALGRG